MNAYVQAFPVTVGLEHPEYAYLSLLEDVLKHGVERGDRTGVGTKGVFGRQIRFDLSLGFPILTTKKLPLDSIVAELLWFLRGETNIKTLMNGTSTCGIWNAWADVDGELGPVYGKQWRSWAAPDGRSIDQISRLIDGLRTNPNSRRHIVSAWNPADVDDMALPPCHCLFQFFVAEGKLSCQLYQRSADLFIGVPFNIASYALLTHMIACVVGLEVGDFVHSFGDAHLYLNHVSLAEQQLERQPYALPTLRLVPKTNVFDFNHTDIGLEDYRAHPHIKAPIAV